METLKSIIIVVGFILLAWGIFTTVQLDVYLRRGIKIPKFLEFNWARLWLVYSIVFSVVLLTCF